MKSYGMDSKEWKKLKKQQEKEQNPQAEQQPKKVV